MSTYEEEHNLHQTTTNNDNNNNNSRTHQTLSTIIQQFLQSDENDNTNPIDALSRALLNLPNSDDLLSQFQKDESNGVSQDFIDSLDRISIKNLQKDQTCSICTNDFLDDEHPLVVQLSCGHKFDLECIAPWLKVHSTCPLCRKDLLVKKEMELPLDEEEEEEDWEMYG